MKVYERQITRDDPDRSAVSDILRSEGLIHSVPMDRAWMVIDGVRPHLEVETWFTDKDGVALLVCEHNTQPHRHCTGDDAHVAINPKRSIVWID